MPLQERKTYFLYGEGRAPDVLCLGNLVLGSYANPTLATHYTHRVLSPDELREHASSTGFKDRVIHAKRGPSYGSGLSGAGLVDFDVSWSARDETILTASAGTRVELKEPGEFLNTQVLKPGGKGVANLKLWLSAPKSDYVMKMRWLRKPDIWMCTGLYLLEGTRVFTVSKKSLDTSVSINSVTIAALTGIPIGGSIKISPETSLTVSSVSEEQLVWAAQYRKLDAKYIRLGDGETATLPNILTLYQDVTSDGTLRRDDKEEMNAVQIDVGGETDEEAQEKEGDSISEEGYYERLEKAIREFEMELED